MINLAVSTVEPTDIEAELLAIAVSEDDLERGELLGAIDARVGGVLRRAAADERFRAKPGQTLVAHVRDVHVRRIALVGLGAAPDASGQALRVAAGCAARIAAGVAAARTAFIWSAGAVTAGDARACEVAAEGALLG